MQQANEVLRLEKETAEKLAAKAFAKSYLSDLVPSVFNNLRENGYFFDPVERDIEVGFMPWIINQTLKELDNVLVGRTLLDLLIKEVVTRRDEDYTKLEHLLLEQEKRSHEVSESKEIETIDKVEERPATEQQQVSDAPVEQANLQEDPNEVSLFIVFNIRKFEIVNLFKLFIFKGSKK